DIIRKVDGVEIEDVRQLIDLISQSKPGKTLSFEILRNN
ncbi:MAG: PDZ domain-containing protein, partial [Succinivibrio sp.]|nr:PDZ domain-containing protein [Succinivibrio sp.]